MGETSSISASGFRNAIELHADTRLKTATIRFDAGSIGTPRSASGALTTALSERGVSLSGPQQAALQTIAATLRVVRNAERLSLENVQALLQRNGVSAEIVVVDNLTSTDGQPLKGFASGGKIYLDSHLSGAELKEVLIEELSESFYQTQVGGFSKGDFGAEVSARLRGEPVGKGAANRFLSDVQDDVTSIVTPDGEIVAGEAYARHQFHDIVVEHTNASRVTYVLGNPGKAEPGWHPVQDQGRIDPDYELYTTEELNIGGRSVPVEIYRKKGSNAYFDSVKRVIVEETTTDGDTAVTHYIARPNRWLKNTYPGNSIPKQHAIELYEEHTGLRGLVDLRTYRPAEGEQPASLVIEHPDGSSADYGNIEEPNRRQPTREPESSQPVEEPVEAKAALEARLQSVNSLIAQNTDPMMRGFMQRSLDALQSATNLDPELADLWNAVLEAAGSGDTAAVETLLADTLGILMRREAAAGTLAGGATVHFPQNRAFFGRMEVTFDDPSVLSGKLAEEDAWEIAAAWSDASNANLTFEEIDAAADMLMEGYGKTYARAQKSVLASHKDSLKVSLSGQRQESYVFEDVRVSTRLASFVDAAAETGELALDFIEEAALGDVGMAVMFNPVAFTLAGFLADKALHAVADEIGRHEHTINHFGLKHFGMKILGAQADNVPGGLVDLLKTHGGMTRDNHIQPGSEIPVADIARILNSETNVQLTQRLRENPTDQSTQASFVLLAITLQNGSTVRSHASGAKLAQLLLSLNGERAFTGGLGAGRTSNLEGVMDFVEWYLGAPGSHPDAQQGFASVMAQGNNYERLLKKASDRTAQGLSTNGRGGLYVGGNMHGVVTAAFQQQNRQLPSITPRTTATGDYQGV